jgi:hypothetical protein
MRWFLILLAALALAFAGAGCGGGDDESASDTDTTTITDSVTDETTDETDETTDEETETDSGGFASDDCQELIESSQALGEALSGANTGAELEEASQRFQDFADEVPEEIRGDVQVLADVFEQYVSVFGDLDLQEGEVPTPQQAQELAAALSTIDQQAVTEASANLTEWSQENC